MGFIWALIVGGVIGAIAGAITKKDHRWVYCQYHCRVSWFNNWSSHFRHMGTKLSWDGYCAIDYRGSDFSCHRFMDFRTKIEKV